MRVLKYHLKPGMNKLMLPSKFDPSGFGEQFRSADDGFEFPRTQQLVMWGIVEDNDVLQQRDFLVVTTGENIPYKNIFHWATISTRLQCHYHVLEVWPENGQVLTNKDRGDNESPPTGDVS